MLRTGLTELVAFITIAEKRSFSVAACALGVSPSALSYTVKNLEKSLNVRLFNRTTRSVALTEAGEQFLRRVGPAIADLQNAENEMISERNRPSGSIRISAAEAGARPLIRHVLPDFLATYPDIHVEIATDYRLTDIAEGKVVVDGNHPLAGMALVFELEVADVRPATPEEIAHGHPHGAGGHAH